MTPYISSRQKCRRPCNLCQSENVFVISLKDRDRKDLRTVACRNCGLIWSDPRPDNNSIREFYSTQYRKAYKGCHTPKPRHIFRDTHSALYRYNFIAGLLHKNDFVLDIGAGTGIFLYVLSEFGYSGTSGIEPDMQHAAFAREQFGVSVENSFLEDFQPDQHFKIITMHHVLEHLEDPLGALQKIYDLLGKNGYLVVEVPNAEDINQDPGNRYHLAHLYTFNPNTLAWMGKKAGLEPIITRIAPHNGNIIILFKKKEVTELPLDIPPENDNCFNIIQTLGGRTGFKHFTSVMPYRKGLKNAVSAINERLNVFRMTDPKDIVASVLKVGPGSTTVLVNDAAAKKA